MERVVWLMFSPSKVSSLALAGRTMRLMTMVIANSKERNFFM